MTQQNDHLLPRFPESYWLEAQHSIEETSLVTDTHVDIAIIGGGITGVTTAFLLVKEGFKVALVDSGPLLNGTTGHTTAKITVQHDLIYNELVQHIGIEKAHLYYQSNMDALHFIKQIVNQYNIPCHFTEENAYLYGVTQQDKKKLEAEWRAYQRLGINGELLSSLPIDVTVTSALLMKNQAHFHPIHYLNSLIDLFIKAGGQIYDNTTAIDIEGDKPTTVIMENGAKLQCHYAVVTSHFPFYDGLGFYFAKMHAERSYILAVKPKKSYPGGMYLSINKPTRSLRPAEINGQSYILIGGESHKTGQGMNTMKHYEVLKEFAQNIFGVKEIPYRWSTQDLITIDKLPFVGPITANKPNILVATGYRKWGMTNGTSAALLIRDTIMEKDSPYKDVYTPSRFYSDPSLKHFIMENSNVAAEFIKGKINMTQRTLASIQKDEAAIVTVNDQRAGAFRDDHNKLHIVDTTCKHLGCEVEWNESERTWDCPCHGSRYSIDGEVIEGPTTKPLKRISDN